MKWMQHANTSFSMKYVRSIFILNLMALASDSWLCCLWQSLIAVWHCSISDKWFKKKRGKKALECCSSFSLHEPDSKKAWMKEGMLPLGRKSQVEILEASEHMVWHHSHRSPLWGDSWEGPGCLLLHVKRLTASAVSWLRVWQPDTEEGLRGQQTPRVPMLKIDQRECLCGGSSHVLLWLYSQLWD